MILYEIQKSFEEMKMKFSPDLPKRLHRPSLCQYSMPSWVMNDWGVRSALRHHPAHQKAQVLVESSVYALRHNPPAGRNQVSLLHDQRLKDQSVGVERIWIDQTYGNIISQMKNSRQIELFQTHCRITAASRQN